jgi:aldehyde:ferredoxin oxidoreductase
VRILRVNMTSSKASWEELPDEWLLLGGRGLGDKILMGEVPPSCEPLSRKNKLVFCCGPLASEVVSSLGRLSVVGKSPLTGGIKEANSGGNAGVLLARQGLRAVIVEGQAPNAKPCLIFIGANGAELRSADHLKGLGTCATASRLQEEYGPNTAIITIGKAGEMLMAAAGVFVTDKDGIPGRAAARGGLGAVMGSKGLKAIVVSGDGKYRIPLADPIAFKEARAELHKMILSSPLTGKQQPTYGTSSLIPTVSEMGAMPTHNFRRGSFDAAAKISGETIHQLITNRGGVGKTTHNCMPGCLVRCSNVFPDEKGNAIVSPLEYETLAMVGSNLDIDDLDTIAEINRRCNDYGIDTIEIGVAIGIAMEQGILPFGDKKSTLRLLDEVSEGTILGRVLGQGAVITGKVLGTNRIPAVKGQGIPAHDPRTIKGMAITYALSPMGADHTAGVMTRFNIDHSKPEGQMEVSRDLQVRMAAVDSVGLCTIALGAGPNTLDAVKRLLEAAYGLSLADDFFTNLGKNIVKTERYFNLKAGLTAAHEQLPEFLLEEPLLPTGGISDIPERDYERFWEESFWGPLTNVL